MSVQTYRYPAQFFDGQTPAKHSVTVHLDPRGLTLFFKDGERVYWPFSSIRFARSGGGTEPTRLEHDFKNEDGHTIIQALLVQDQKFLDGFEHFAKDSLGLHSTLHLPKHKKLRNFLLIAAFLFVPLFLYGVWIYGVPKLTDGVAEKVPVEWEVKLGDTVAESILKKSLQKPTPQAQEAMEKIVQRLLKTVPDQPYTIRVHIHPSKMVNAMALPGGHVIIFRGLLEKSDTPEELAGVMAHELQHVLQRHSTKGIVRGVALSILLAIVVGDANQVMGLIMDAASELESLNFSRKMEAEADEKGMMMMLAANVDPEGMVKIFEKLKEEEKKMLGDGSFPDKREHADDDDGNDDSSSDEKSSSSNWKTYLSTHPAGENRVAMLKEMIENNPVKIKPLLPDVNWKTIQKKSFPKTEDAKPS